MSYEFSSSDLFSAAFRDLRARAIKFDVDIQDYLQSDLDRSSSKLKRLVTGEVSSASFDVDDTSIVVFHRFGYFYVRVTSMSMFLFAFTISDQGVITRVAPGNAGSGYGLSVSDLVAAGVSKVYFPILRRGAVLTDMQAAVLSDCSLKVEFVFADRAQHRSDIFSFEGVFFIRDQVFPNLGGRTEFHRSSVSSFGDAVHELAASGEFFISEHLPFEAQKVAITHFSLKSASPVFKPRRFGKGVVVPVPVTSTKLARRKYTESYLEFMQIKSSLKNAPSIVRIVSRCVESIESSVVWRDEEMSVLAPRLDSFREAGDILDCLRELHSLYVDLLPLKGSLPDDQFGVRMSVVQEGVEALMERTASFMDYAAELDRLSSLVEEKHDLVARMSAEVDAATAASDWDLRAAGVLGQAAANRMAASSNRDFNDTLADLSADISDRIEYLEQVATKQALLRA